MCVLVIIYTHTKKEAHTISANSDLLGANSQGSKNKFLSQLKVSCMQFTFKQDISQKVTLQTKSKPHYIINLIYKYICKINMNIRRGRECF